MEVVELNRLVRIPAKIVDWPIKYQFDGYSIAEMADKTILVHNKSKRLVAKFHCNISKGGIAKAINNFEKLLPNVDDFDTWKAKKELADSKCNDCYAPLYWRRINRIRLRQKDANYCNLMTFVNINYKKQ